VRKNNAMKLSRVTQVCAILALAATGALADTITINGDTTGQPTWNRPIQGAPPTTLSAVGTAVPYTFNLFSVVTGGPYDISLNAVADSWDTYLFLYSFPFDSSQPLTNVLAGDDDGGSGLNSDLQVNLTAGAPYVVVATGFGNTDFGAFTLQITSVPEPMTITMAGLGLFGLGLARRRRRI
jgi:PEP-CTERM motif